MQLDVCSKLNLALSCKTDVLCLTEPRATLRVRWSPKNTWHIPAGNTSPWRCVAPWTRCIKIGVNRTGSMAENRFWSITRWQKPNYWLFAAYSVYRRSQEELHLRPPVKCHNSPCLAGHTPPPALWLRKPLKPPCQSASGLHCIPVWIFQANLGWQQVQQHTYTCTERVHLIRRLEGEDVDKKLQSG